MGRFWSFSAFPVRRISGFIGGSPDVPVETKTRLKNQKYFKFFLPLPALSSLMHREFCLIMNFINSAGNEFYVLQLILNIE